MAFIVDDILIGWLVIPAVERLRDHLLDTLDASVDDGLRVILRKLVDAVKKPDLGERKRAVDEAGAELSTFVKESPEAVPLLAAASTSDVMGGSDDVEHLEAIADFLNYVFRMVELLKRPVLLRGFFTGVDHCALIDVRTSGGVQFQPPTRRFGEKGLVPKIAFDSGRPLLRMPRIWLIDSGDSKPDELNARKTLPAKEFAAALEGYLRVTEMTVDTISTVANPGTYAIPDIFSNKPVDRTKQRRTVDFYMSESPAGVVSMRGSLEAAVAAESDRLAEWSQNWSDALRIEKP